MSTSKTYMVAHDLSEVANVALKHAIALAKPVKAEIIVLHLVNNDSKIPEAKALLSNHIDKLNLDLSKITIRPLVVKGSIFEDIGKLAEKYDCSKIIMGTHGAVGMQKVFGSNALKVIRSTSMPFHVVQNNIQKDEIKNIVLPIDVSKESLQIIPFASDIALLFKSKVHLVAKNQKDMTLLRQIKNRLKIVEQKFKELGVDAQVQMIDATGTYSNNIITYAGEINADLIAFAYNTGGLFPGLDTFHQGLLMNSEKIPALIVQAKDVTSSYF
jgi:nucleotide-binding universal stress UspA family protein